MDRPLVNDVLFNDGPDPVGGCFGVPDAIGPDQEDRTAFAHSQAIGFASQNDALRSPWIFQIQLSDHLLEFIPAGVSCFRIAAFAAGGCGAEQQVMADSPLCCHGFLHAASEAAGTRRVPRFTHSRTAWRAH